MDGEKKPGSDSVDARSWGKEALNPIKSQLMQEEIEQEKARNVNAGWIRDTVGDTDLAEALRPYAEKETVTGRQLSNIRPIIRARLNQYKEVLPDLDSYKTSPPLY